MTDHFDASMFLDEAEGDELEMEGGYKEYAVVLIDAQPNMLEPCTLEDKMFQGKSWLEASVQIAGAILRTKVIQGAEDEVAVVFYNTGTKKNDKDIEGVYVKHSMGQPDAGRVLQLKNFNLAKDFNTKIGAGSSDINERNEALDYSLSVANAFLPGLQKRTNAYIDQRVVVFTRDAAPGTLNKSIKSKAENIASKGGLLQLAPLFNKDTEGFNLKQFWGDLLSHAAESHPDADSFSQEEDKFGYEQDQENLLSLEALSSIIRMRAYRKRAITRIPWTLGPGGATIGVKLYQTIKSAWPGAKGSAVPVDPIDNKPLVKAKPTTLDAQTGIPLEPSQAPRLYYPKEHGTTLPVKYAKDSDEIRQLKFPAPKGLSLLGFQPVEDLKPWHQYREATFIYPDEKTMPGSLVAFSALLSAMIEREVMAVCSFVRGPSAEPRLVALIPQKEESDAETGAMITPAGMHMYYLPYADEIRYPELDTAFTGTERPQPSAEAIAAATELINALDLDDEVEGAFDPANIPNPHMQHWFKVVEEKAIALEAENEDGGSDEDEGGGGGSDDDDGSDDDMKGASDKKEVEDLSLPSAFDVDDLVDRFIVAVCGAGNEGLLMGQRKKGTKRAAAAPAAKLNDEEKAAALEGIDFAGKFADGTLATLKNDELKLYCEVNGLKKSGNKANLVERIKEHFESKQ